MLHELELVAGAVDDKNVCAALTALCFHNGRVQGGNGRVTVEVPLALPLLAGYRVPAARFLKGVLRAGGSLRMAPSESGITLRGDRKFSTRVPLLPAADYPLVPPPTGDPFGRLDTAPLRECRAFVATDASRAFATTQLFRDGYVYATNNVVIARTPVEYTGPEVAIPVQCVDELLRLPFTEYDIRRADNGLYFSPPGQDLWVHTRSTDLPWPKQLNDLFAGMDFAGLPEVDAQGLLADVVGIRDLCPDSRNPVIRFTADGMMTLVGTEGDARVGEDDVVLSSWRAEVLELVLPRATHVDFSKYPGPCPWRGGNIQGVMVGVRT